MAITFDANRKIFTIHTKQTTYQMQADANGYLLHLYYGARTKGSPAGGAMYGCESQYDRSDVI